MSEHPGKTVLDKFRRFSELDVVCHANTRDMRDILAYVAELEAAPSKARNAALEEAARVAEGDVDWARFGKKDIQPWEDGPDSVRDYRLGIASGRAIAVAIRQLKEGS